MSIKYNLPSWKHSAETTKTKKEKKRENKNNLNLLQLGGKTLIPKNEYYKCMFL